MRRYTILAAHSLPPPLPYSHSFVSRIPFQWKPYSNRTLVEDHLHSVPALLLSRRLNS